ncbi:MAG: transcription elongation factor GreA [Chloroflexota bacterium]|nr:transcription elongation factor GreA [Chloroflexota bacterium]
MTTETPLGTSKIGQLHLGFVRGDASRRLSPEDLGRLRKFVTWCGISTSIEAVQPFKVEEFLAHQTNTSQPPRLYMPALKAFFAYALDQGALAADPMRTVRLPRGAGTAAKKSAAAALAHGGPAGSAAGAAAVARAAVATAANGTGDSNGTNGASLLDDDVVYVSRAHRESMHAELERLRTDERHRISQMLHEAIKDGDLSENAAYDDAKMRQGMLEARIRELESKLRHSELIEDQAVTTGVGVGSHVRLVEVASGDELDYQVVGPEETNPRGGKISHRSPVGRAILGRMAGDEVEVTTPGGAVRYRIKSVE